MNVSINPHGLFMCYDSIFLATSLYRKLFNMESSSKEIKVLWQLQGSVRRPAHCSPQRGRANFHRPELCWFLFQNHIPIDYPSACKDSRSRKGTCGQTIKQQDTNYCIYPSCFKNSSGSSSHARPRQRWHENTAARAPAMHCSQGTRAIPGPNAQPPIP